MTDQTDLCDYIESLDGDDWADFCEEIQEKKRGRPVTGNALTPAQKQKAYRDRKKANSIDIDVEKLISEINEVKLLNKWRAANFFLACNVDNMPHDEMPDELRSLVRQFRAIGKRIQEAYTKEKN